MFARGAALVLPLLVLLLMVGTARADVLRIGTEADDAPFGGLGPDGKLVGFDIDIGNAVCARLKVTCQWVNMDFDGLVPALNAHRIDAALSQISVTPARSKRVLFSDPVSRTAGVLVATVGGGVTNNPASLKGKTLGVQSGTTHEIYARMVYGKDATIQVYQTQLEAFADLVAGRIDATLCDQGAAFKWLEGHAGTFGFAGKPIDDASVFGTGTAFAFRLGDAALKKRVDDALHAIEGDGTYAAINARYFPFSIAPAGVQIHP